MTRINIATNAGLHTPRMKPLVTSPSMHIAAAPPLLLHAWTGVAPSIAEVKAAMAKQVEAVKGFRQQRAALVVLIHPSTPLPSEDLRETLKAEMQKLLPHLLLGVTLIPSAGFRAAAMRAVVTTLQLVVRPGHKEKVVAGPDEAAAFLCRELDDPELSITSLQTTITQFAEGAWSKGVLDA